MSRETKRRNGHTQTLREAWASIRMIDVRQCFIMVMGFESNWQNEKECMGNIYEI